MRLRVIVLTLLAIMLLAACGGDEAEEPQVEFQEVTRVVTEREEVEVTRVVTEQEQVEVEATRLVEHEVQVLALPEVDPLHAHVLQRLARPSPWKTEVAISEAIGLQLSVASPQLQPSAYS